MNVMTGVHSFLDGKPKRMLIDGKWLKQPPARLSRHSTLPRVSRACSLSTMRKRCAAPT